MNHVLLLCAVLMAGAGGARAQHVAVPLWAGGAPGSQGKTAPEAVTTTDEGERHVASVNNPSLTPYLVRGASGARVAPTAAVIIAPGGGHALLSIDHEGYDVAKYLSGHGIAAFVLKYRLAKEKGSTYTVEGDELKDVQRAIRTVRARAAEWNVDPTRVGLMGFSAGGELTLRAAEAGAAEAAGTGAGAGSGAAPAHAGAASGGTGAASADTIDTQSDRLDFVALMYPGGLTPELIGKVTAQAPPAFMLCGADDRDTIALALPQLFLAWKKAGVSAELHEYAGVGHGFGLRLSQHGAVAEWPAVFVDWMETRGLLHGK